MLGTTPNAEKMSLLGKLASNNLLLTLFLFSVILDIGPAIRSGKYKQNRPAAVNPLKKPKTCRHLATKCFEPQDKVKSVVLELRKAVAQTDFDLKKMFPFMSLLLGNHLQRSYYVQGTKKSAEIMVKLRTEYRLPLSRRHSICLEMIMIQSEK